MALVDQLDIAQNLDDDIPAQRDRLLVRLAGQRKYVAKMWRWYRGRQELPIVTGKYRREYQLLLDQSITPWARLVVDTIAERLRVQGIYSATSQAAAKEAWQTFRRCRMDGDQRLIYTEALVSGCGYVSAQPLESGDVLLAAESAFEVTHEHAQGLRRAVAAALKLYPMDAEHETWICELYRPEGTYRWMTWTDRPRAGGFPIDTRYAAGTIEWASLDGRENPTGVVPMVPFENRYDVLSEGSSEIEDLIPILKRIDKLTLDAMLSSDVAAFRQKWATGLEVPTDPDTGKRIEPFRAAVDRLWVSDKQDTKFGTFEASDLGQYLTSIDSQIATLAAISRVPAHYLMQRNLANPPSAESLVASESGLVAKVEDHQSEYSDSWERVHWLAARFAGHDVAIDELDTQWMDAEKRNPAQVADAAVKLQTVGWPAPAVWAYTGATPEQIEEWKREAAAADLLSALVLPVEETPTLPAGGPA